ncbi:methyl-accepting chemotaxis protein [Litoribacterium kuwaitense]|uniref:methyl-accepting chemotaxis protein n=1 Tax=Litoribacterium kuwaitense TaxID=1398745 RepID=UPI001FEBDBE7|nr:methyl-accepting chemotaxis protein [Litoribacterium kuwaitense]
MKRFLEHRQRFVFDAVVNNLAIIEFGIDRRVSYVNDIFAKQMGFFHKEELIGVHHKTLCFDSFVNSPDYERFWKGLLNGRSHQDKICRKDANGHAVWLEATYMPVFDQGEIIGILKIATDITNRQQNISEVVENLQEMAAQFYEKAEQGIQNHRVLTSNVKQIAQDSQDNTQILLRVKNQAGDIENVVKTIRDIAAKTNILSLNAAIEAARAGEHGRGFDIVAQEVRKLSQQVDQSIHEVKDNIEKMMLEITNITEGIMESKKSVEFGVEQIQVAASGYEDILKSGETLKQEADRLRTII